MSERPQDPGEVSDDIVDAAWRARSREQPPSGVDAAIRAAARRAIASGPASGRSRKPHSLLRNWRPFAAVAAVAVLAFGLLRWIPQDQLTAVGPNNETGRLTSPSLAKERSADRAPMSPSEDDAEDSAGSPSLLAQPKSEQKQSAELASDAPVELPAAPPPAAATRLPHAELNATAVAPQPAPARGDAATDMSHGAPPITARQEPQSEPPESRERYSDTAANVAKARRLEGESTAMQQGSASSAASAPAQREPAAFVHEIEALHAAGVDDRAAEQLRQFRAAYPNADDYLPQDLKAWAASIKR